MVSETLAEVMRDQSADLTERALVKAQAAGVEPTKAALADFIREDLQTTINVSHLGESVAALLMGLDPTVAGYTAANALYNNFALSTVRKAIEEYGEALAAGAHESFESVKSALEEMASETLERIADILENHPEQVAMCAEIMVLSIVAAREERMGRPANHAAGVGRGPTGQKIEAQKKEGITAMLKAAPKFFKDLARSIRSAKVGVSTGGGASAAGAANGPAVTQSTSATPSSVATVARPASSAATQPLLRNQLIAEQIASGHALEKHVVSRGEFPGWIRTKAQLKQHVEHVLNDSLTRQISIGGGKTLHIHEPTHTVVLHNPNASDGGTVFQPLKSIAEFLSERKWK